MTKVEFIRTYEDSNETVLYGKKLEDGMREQLIRLPTDKCNYEVGDEFPKSVPKQQKEQSHVPQQVFNARGDGVQFIQAIQHGVLCAPVEARENACDGDILIGSFAPGTN